MTVKATIQDEIDKISEYIKKKLPWRQSAMYYAHVAETRWVTTAGKKTLEDKPVQGMYYCQIEGVGAGNPTSG